MGLLRNAFRWAELPPREDIQVWEGTTRWGNHDIYPIPKKEQTYGMLGFFSYFIVSGVSITGFTVASSYVAAGLSAWETVGAVLVGCVIAGLNSFIGGQAGVDKKLGFTMMIRAAFGLWGQLIPLVIGLSGNVIFSGIQAYYGGQAVTLILGAVIPQFHSLRNTLPLSAAITTKELIGFFLFYVCFMPIVFYVPMHKLRRWLYPSCIITAVTFFGILGWAIHQNGGTGPIIASKIKLTSMERSFKFLQCVSSTAASWSGSGDRLSDWTRFSRYRHASSPALLVGLVLSMVPTAIVGVLVTSAFYQMYGTSIWTPLGMLLYVQGAHYTPACRAGTFFAGIGLLTSQIYVNVVQNTMAFGMDFAGIFPRYMSMKRGAVLLCVVGIACNPWRFLSQAAIFIQAFSVFAVFSSCSTPITNCDYWLVRRRKWKIPDLYHPEGIYWYFHGVNLRAVAAWTLAIIPSLPGFAYSMMGGEYLLRPEYKIYQMTFFVGYPLAGALHYLFSWLFPPVGLGIQEQLEGYDEDGANDVIQGISVKTAGEIEKEAEGKVGESKIVDSTAESV
ncbi:hypothetical protein BP6252_13909 [Coleophoma cylindrospora]|uniref:Uncharacterized protein n=1 Tax=Coleophoma cylindrospora TaxID=1849047 RepID=A0A3D8Q5T1_9HELO|nr:hypothetical protein BP6252_13909 [Coleophoma cylindrospora]